MNDPIEIQGISVVICTHNGSDRICATLNSILNQEIKEDLNWELLVIDNCSTDKTYETATQFLENNNPKFSWRVIREPKAGLNTARITGLLESKYTWVLFCDDDNHLFQNYLNDSLPYLFNVSTLGALGGCGIPKFDAAEPEWFNRYSQSFAVGPQAIQSGKINEYPAELYGAGSFFRKHALLDLIEKGFKPIMTDRIGERLVSGGDVEFCWLIQLKGYEVWYLDELKFYHLISDKRLSWDYYLNLKKGIANGFGLMQSYWPFLANSNPSFFHFLTNYVIQLFRHNLILIYFLIRKKINPSRYTFEETSIGQRVLTGKVVSLLINFNKAKNHFFLLKKQFFASV